MTTDELWDDEAIDQANAPKGLRDAYKALKKGTDEKIASLEERLAKAETNSRAATIDKAVTKAGLPAKIAGFYPSDAEATPEAIQKWLTDNADVFSAQQGDGGTGEEGETSTTTPPTTSVSPEMQQLMTLLQQAGVLPPTGAPDVIANINKAQTREELENLIRTGQAG